VDGRGTAGTRGFGFWRHKDSFNTFSGNLSVHFFLGIRGARWPLRVSAAKLIAPLSQADILFVFFIHILESLSVRKPTMSVKTLRGRRFLSMLLVLRLFPPRLDFEGYEPTAEVFRCSYSTLRECYGEESMFFYIFCGLWWL